MATPFGRVAVPIAAATPASAHCSRCRNSRHAAAQTMSAVSAYDHDSTTEPGNRANSTIDRWAVAVPYRSRASKPTSTTAATDSTTLTPSSAWTMPPGNDEVEPPCQVWVHGKEGDRRPVAGDVGDPLGKFARIAVLGDHSVPLAVPLREDRLDHRPRALRERVAPALAVGDDLGRPGVGTEQHDQAGDGERRSRQPRPVPLATTTR